MKTLALRRLPLGFVAAASLGMVILLSLGTWQVLRRFEKEALLAHIRAGMAAPPIALSVALERRHGGEDVSYLRVHLTGRYRPGPQLRLFRPYQGMAGWRLVAVFESDDAGDVLVDRGFVPDELKNASATALPAGRVALNGVLRLHRRAKGPFTPDNKPGANEWFWWDLQAMDRAVGLAPRDVPALVVHLQPDAGDPRWPRATGVDLSSIPNHHLQYAATWFGLALTLAIMAFSFVRKSLGRADDDNHPDR